MTILIMIMRKRCIWMRLLSNFNNLTIMSRLLIRKLIINLKRIREEALFLLKRLRVSND